MKNIILRVLWCSGSIIGSLIYFFILVLSSCTDDPLTFSELIIGRWQLKEVSGTNSLKNCDYDGWVEFKIDRSYLDYDACLLGISDGGWKIEGKVMTIQSALLPFPVQTTITTLTKTEFVFEGNGIKRSYGRLK